MMTETTFDRSRRLVRPIRLLVIVGLGLITMVLAGCASQGIEQSRYTLPSEVKDVDVAGNFRGSVWLAPPNMASYLKDGGIVMQLGELRIHQARHHLWAEPLARQLQERMRRHLAQALPNAEVLLRGQPAAAPSPALHVQLDVDRFQGRDDGMAVVSGEWRIRDDQDRTLSRESFKIARPLEDDGYPALVRALGAAWKTLGDRLAETLAEVEVKTETH
ncbi:membrane integrity-associated transporter subunit PqiC [Chromohalobacter sp. HP20-39]|uniref:PqiC family protein n=1 Tax=Chromohalobacter sp. HP20-39 TaxID=3079306 RepID=UPI00294B0C3D|nr:ABC-type transport auxiliary lipoprotein family protein [Chromohalobacter sp. HP20-39]MDV6319104.1 ABC-type transport auxiliary lipoprotein family protein [Chromohalobacter sp. HP20-39]